MKALRIHSVNIVNHITKIREISSYSIMNGKYNLNRVNKSYNYDGFYLLKMINDLDFLNQSSLENYFNFSSESDPFLMNISDEKSHGNQVPINEDMLATIKQSEFIMRQEMLFYQIQNMNLNDQNNGLDHRGSFGSYQNVTLMPKKSGSSSKLYNTPNMSQFLHQLRSGKNYDQLFLYNNNLGANESCELNVKKSAKLKIKIEREEIHSMTRSELIHQMEEFEKLKKDEQKRLEKEKEKERLKLKREEEKGKISLKKEEEEKERKSQKKKKKKEEEEKKNKQLKDNEVSKHSEELCVNESIEDIKEKQKDDKLFQKAEEQFRQEEEKARLQKEEDEDRRKQEEERQRKEKDLIRKQEEDESQLQQEDERLRRKAEAEERELLHQKAEEEKRLRIEEEERLQKEEEEKQCRRKEEEKRLKKEDEERLQNEEEARQKNDRLLKEEVERIKKEEEECLKRVSNTFHIVNYFNKSLSYINQNYQMYYEILPEDQKTTFKTDLNITNFTQGLNPKIIVAYKDENQTSIIGLCQIAYESFSSRYLKLQINHLSTCSKDWKRVIISMIDFIKKEFKYDEINLILYYKFENNEFSIDKEIMSLFKETLGFKWIKIENLTNNERNQLISYQNTKEETKIIIPSLISLNTVTMINLTSNEFKCQMPFDKYLNVFSVTYLVNLLKTYGYTLSTDNMNKKQLTEWNVGTIKTDLNSVFTVGGSRFDEYSNSFFEFGNISMKEDNEIIYHCTMHYLPKLNSNISSVYNGYIYNRLQGNIGILQDKKTKQNFYLIPSDDNANSLFISELTPQLRDRLVNNGQNIYELFFEYFRSLEQNSEDKTLTSALWLPTFSINTHIIADKLSYLDEIKIESEENKIMFIRNIDEYINASYDYDQNIINSFQVEASENDIVISNNFLFGLVNVNILSKMNIPSISFFLITQEHWLKPNNS